MGTTTLLQLNPLSTSMARMQGGSTGSYEVTLQPINEPLPNYKPDMFAYKGNSDTPWVSEQTKSFSSPTEYTGRILSGSLVHTGGCTKMAHTTYHVEERPHFPPGTIRGTTFTQLQYVPTADPALDELHAVAHVVAPHLDALVGACQAYHAFTPDGWISTAGFMTAARRAGLQLSRAEFLALERALSKDTLGRINYLQLQGLVASVAGTTGGGEGAQ